MKRFRWFVFAFFAVTIGLYPLSYVLFDMSAALLSQKPSGLLKDAMWRAAFYIHIFLGGVVLLVGWSQFSDRLRLQKVYLHRSLGKIYVIGVLLSGVAAFYISFFATGGIIAKSGFNVLAILWVFITVMAYVRIQKKEIASHQRWMIRSYALTFAAVTLRIWLPTFQLFLDMTFLDAYKIIAWLCWVPNLMVAEFIIRKKHISAPSRHSFHRI